MCVKYFLFFFVHLVSAVEIAIVGGGVGGTSAAYFLNELFHEKVNIDLYEASKIGGRLSTITIDEDEYEVGGAIIHEKNKHAVDLIKAMNLTHRDSGDVSLSLFGDKGAVFTGSKYQIITNLKLLWRYKWQLIKLDRFLTDMLSRFSRIYTFQNQLNSFNDVSSLLYAADPDFVKSLTVSTKKGFAMDGFSEEIIDELIFAGLRCNYGQSTSVHKFVGAVSTSGSGSNLFSIAGGNKQLPIRLLESSGANLIRSQVDIIEKTDSGQYNIKTNDSSSKTYDFVIMATPLTKDQKRQINFDIGVPVNVPGHYHTTVCTIVKGNLNSSYFGYDRASDVPDLILTVSEDLFFNSIGRIKPVNGMNKKQIWKIFSKAVLSDVELKQLFKNFIVLDTIDWLAYPHYDVNARNDSFELSKNLYYINAIEWAASAIEMSLIGARNVALLVYKELGPIQGDDFEHDEL